MYITGENPYKKVTLIFDNNIISRSDNVSCDGRQPFTGRLNEGIALAKAPMRIVPYYTNYTCQIA